MKTGFKIYCMVGASVQRLNTGEFTKLIEKGSKEYAGQTLRCGNIYVAADEAGEPYVFRSHYFALHFSGSGKCQENYSEWTPVEREKQQLIGRALFDFGSKIRH